MWIPLIIPFGTRNKSKIVDNKKRTCVNCHNNGVQLVKNDEWFHLFFIPLAKVKSGNRFLQCPSCGAVIPYVEETHMPQFNNPDDVKFVPEDNKSKQNKYDAPKANIPPEYYQQPPQQPPNYYNNVNNAPQYYQQQDPINLEKQQQDYYNNYQQQNDYKSNNNNSTASENLNNTTTHHADDKEDKKEKKHLFKRNHKEKHENKE